MNSPAADTYVFSKIYNNLMYTHTIETSPHNNEIGKNIFVLVYRSSLVGT